jgi:hypothetical protein
MNHFIFHVFSSLKRIMLDSVGQSLQLFLVGGVAEKNKLLILKERPRFPVSVTL